MAVPATLWLQYMVKAATLVRAGEKVRVMELVVAVTSVEATDDRGLPLKAFDAGEEDLNPLDETRPAE